METEQTINVENYSVVEYSYMQRTNTHLIVYTYTYVVSKYPRHGSYTFEYVMIVTIYM